MTFVLQRHCRSLQYSDSSGHAQQMSFERSSFFQREANQIHGYYLYEMILMEGTLMVGKRKNTVVGYVAVLGMSGRSTASIMHVGSHFSVTLASQLCGDGFVRFNQQRLINILFDRSESVDGHLYNFEEISDDAFQCPSYLREEKCQMRDNSTLSRCDYMNRSLKNINQSRPLSPSSAIRISSFKRKQNRKAFRSYLRHKSCQLTISTCERLYQKICFLQLCVIDQPRSGG